MKNFTLTLILLILSSVNSYSQSGWFWQNPLPQGNELFSVKFIDENTGFAVGGAGTIIKTINGGLNWEVKTGITLKNFFCLSFTNTNTGYALGSNGILYKTQNQGINWDYINTGEQSDIISIFFSDDNTGYAVNSFGRILKTTNSGNNWNSLSPTINNLQSLHFTNNLIGYACSDNKILKTTNGGNNWFDLFETTGTSFTSIFFSDVNTGFTVGSIGKIF